MDFSKNRSAFGKTGERERVLFVAAAGLAFSLLVIMLVILNFQASEATAAKDLVVASSASNVGTVTLYLPDRPIKSGQKISDVALTETFWPRNQVPDGAVVDRNEVKDMYARVDIPTGMPLQRNLLVENPIEVPLSVTPGNRAVTIDIDQTTGIESFAQPGTRIDVVLTYFLNGQLTSKVIVQNARVLASGSSTKSFSEKGMMAPSTSPALLAMAPKTVTLDVSTKDALKVTTSRQMGRMSLVMRSAEDNNVTPESEMNADQLSGESKPKKLVESQAKACTKGHIRVSGQEFQLNCDGSMIPVAKD